MIRVLEPNKDYIIRADRSGIVEDVVEVVRCKDCKHFSKYLSEEKEDGVCWHNNADFEVTCNHFCSWGKRREDGRR